MALALSPVLSRVYDPAEFGVFSAAVALSSAFVGFSTLRLEVLALGTEDDAESSRLIWLGFIVLMVMTTLVLSAAIVAYWGFGAPVWTLLMAPMVFFASLQLIGSAVYVRSRRYKRLSTANFAHQAGTPVFQVALGIGGLGVYGLLVGFGLARSAWVPALVEAIRSGSCRRTDTKADLRQIRRGFVPGSSGLINSVAGQLLILIPIAVYGTAVGGLIGMAVRIMISPLSLIAQSVAAAANGQIGHAFRSGNFDTAVNIAHRGMRDQLAIGAVPLTLAGVGAPWVIPPLLGEQWRGAGLAISALALGALFQFAIAPFAQILNIADESRALLIWDTLRLLSYAMALTVPQLTGHDWKVALWLYSAAQVLVYIGLAWLVTYRLRRRVESAETGLRPPPHTASEMGQ